MTNFSRDLPTIMIFFKCNIEKQRRGRKKKREHGKVGKWESGKPPQDLPSPDWSGLAPLYSVHSST